jgi:Antitoxin-like ribbon-helix-helix
MDRPRRGRKVLKDELRSVKEALTGERFDPARRKPRTGRRKTPLGGSAAEGKKVVTYYLDPEPFTQLTILSAKTGITIQDLSLEALNLLFEQHQVSRIAR